MKRGFGAISIFLSVLAVLFVLSIAQAQDDVGEVTPLPPPAPAEEKDYDGWLLGSDQGVLFFVGDSSNFIGPQYYGTIFGGYNFRGIFQPMLRLGQALGSLNGFFAPTTFFFIFESAFRITPVRKMFTPYFIGTAGMYVLSFDNFFGSPVDSGVNFTYSGGGGIQINFGHNQISVGSAFRGFLNNGPDLNSVEVTLGYGFQF